MRLVDAVVYGEIYNRPAVDLRTRSLCTIAALVVLGHSPQMIKRHITGALHIGVTEEEISEIIAQMVFYGGMPAAVNAFRIAKETFDEQAGRVVRQAHHRKPGGSADVLSVSKGGPSPQRLRSSPTAARTCATAGRKTYPGGARFPASGPARRRATAGPGPGNPREGAHPDRRDRE